MKDAGTISHPAPAVHASEGSDPKGALKDSRQVNRCGQWQDTAVKDRGLLRSGNVVARSAIVEAVNSTYVVPAGASLRVEQYLNGIIEFTR